MSEIGKGLEHPKGGEKLQAGRLLEGGGTRMHSREWLAMGLDWGWHLCAETKFGGVFGGCGVPGPVSGILGAGLMSREPGGVLGDVCVLGPDFPGGLSPCSKHRGEQILWGWRWG